MSFRDIIILKKLGLGIVTFTGVLTAMMGGWLLFSIFSVEPNTSFALQNHDLEIEETERAPSSIPTTVLAVSESETIEITKQNTKIETVKLGCVKDGSRIEIKSTAKQLRLKGQLCPGYTLSLKESSIINRANGFEATLFGFDRGEFTSDYISLDEGTNQLFLQMTDGSGARFVSEMTITR